LSGRQDRMMVVKKCCAFKAERHRDENKVTILGACAIQVHCRVLREWGWGRCAGCVRTLRVCVSGDLVRLGWGVNRDAEAEAEAEVGVLEADASAAVMWF
jgi:hypothetical protein